MIEYKIDPNASSNEVAQNFYGAALKSLNESGIPYLVGGAFAINHFTGIFRDTKDLDIFCRPTDYEKILRRMMGDKYEIEVHDVRWLAKVFHEGFFIDIIFSSVNNICRVDDVWFENAVAGEVYNVPVKYVSAEEMFWCKMYVQNRERYDGCDINHIILKYGDRLDWKRVLKRMDNHWQLMLQQVINFQFVYPAERDQVPRWIFDELIARAQGQFDLPTSVQRVCRGPLIENLHYAIDIKEWNYKSMTITST